MIVTGIKMCLPSKGLTLPNDTMLKFKIILSIRVENYYLYIHKNCWFANGSINQVVLLSIIKNSYRKVKSEYEKKIIYDKVIVFITVFYWILNCVI